MRSAPAPTSGFVRLTCEDLPPGDRCGMPLSCCASRRPSNCIRCSSRAELWEPLRCNEEGLSQRTAAAETACRTGPAPFT